MPRTARFVIPDISVHVVQRGHDGQDCFFEDSDRIAYLDFLHSFAVRFQCSVHAYCLMSNHVHLLVTPSTEDGCALLMKHLGQHYVQRINARLNRVGTLWQGRYYSCPVASERYVLACYRYIERNPVAAGIVSQAGDYPWSSFAGNARGGCDGFLRPHVAYLGLADDRAVRTAAYRELVDTPLEQPVLDEIRSATRGGYVMGAERGSRRRRK